MNLSHYFEVLSAAYAAEIDDLATDFEGKTVLPARLREKRAEINTMLQMIESAPEMVAPVFYGAFSFLAPAVMFDTLRAEPDDEGFPLWDSIADSIRLADWAKPLVLKFLADAGGDRFLVSVAAVEFLRSKSLALPDTSPEVIASEKKEENENGDGEGGRDGDGDDQDLGEAGADWLTEQGFDARSN